MPSRYCRDEIITIALDQAQIPALKVHDIPHGVVQQDAFATQWLQDVLDFWYHMVPFSATVDSVPLVCTANSDTIVLPSDFILDVRNGYVTQQTPGDTKSLRRRLRVPLQKFINRQLYYQTTSDVKTPYYYCIVGDDEDITTQYQTMKVTPTPTIATQGVLWYYKLPAPLRAQDRPKVANDYVCIEYVKIRAREWAGLYDPGTAETFCNKIIAGMKASGLMNEPEDDEIPFDVEQYYRGRNRSNLYSTYAWLGNV